MTVNLLNGEASPRHLEQVLQAHDPDIMLAQELAPNAGEVIERHFPHGVVKPVCDYRGKAIVAKSPISVEELEFPYRSIMRGVMDDGLEILNVHLANPVDSWRGRLVERRRQVRALEELITTPRPRILAGDFNSTPAWPAYRRINRLSADTVADLARTSGTPPGRTWGWRPGWPLMLRIDHVFATGFQATEVEVVEVRGSDHRAVIVDLERA